MRTRRREWKNGSCLPKWTVRIIWYDDNAGPMNELGGDIKLTMLDCEGEKYVLPKSLDAAEQIWQMFMQAAPKERVSTPIVDMVIELSKKYGLLKHDTSSKIIR